MKERWYDKSMPTIQEVYSSVHSTIDKIKKIKGVNDVKLFGSFAENIKNPLFSIKDVDILILSSFDSGDLLAIDNDSDILFKSKEDIENEGYDYKSIFFTKFCYTLKNTIFDIWIISKDKKILHMGQMPESIEEWQDIRKEAEKETELKTGIVRKELHLKSMTERTEWKDTYDKEINKYFLQSPYGWYLSTAKIKDVLLKSIDSI